MIPQRPFRFGVQSAQAASHEEWKAKAKRAEVLGYDILLMPDHLTDQFASYWSGPGTGCRGHHDAAHRHVRAAE